MQKRAPSTGRHARRNERGMNMRKVLHIFAAVVLLFIIASILTAPCFAEADQPAAAQIDLTPVFQALIALLATIITVKVIPWIKARTTAQQQDLLAATTKVIVYAAEQLYGSGMGETKLIYVEEELRKRGYTIDRAAIEAAVRELTIVQSKPPGTSEEKDE